MQFLHSLKVLGIDPNTLFGFLGMSLLILEILGNGAFNFLHQRFAACSALVPVRTTSKIDIFRKPLNDSMCLGKGCSSFENH